MYEKRTYRQHMGEGRFASLSISVQESDLWIGYQGTVDQRKLESEAMRILRQLRLELLTYDDPRLLSSLVPLMPVSVLSPFLASMFEAAKRAGVGPMASVAGAIAQVVGQKLKQQFSLQEIVVENGGDLYIDVLQPLSVKLIAPTSTFSGKVSILVDPALGPMGVCTSSARFGHSLSFGKADAVLVATQDAALADAYATAYCNQVQKQEDVQRICELLSAKPEVFSALVALDATLAVGGRLEVCT